MTDEPSVRGSEGSTWQVAFELKDRKFRTRFDEAPTLLEETLCATVKRHDAQSVAE